MTTAHDPVFVQRHAERSIREAMTDTPVTLLIGPRQAGKSTLVKRIASAGTYVTLDDPHVLDRARTDPVGLVREGIRPLVIDEVQRAPDLLIAIKHDVDQHRQPGAFLITGSVDVLTLPTVSESLAGRMAIVRLWPFSEAEIRGVEATFIDALFARTPPTRGDGTELLDRSTLAGMLARGGFPEATTRQAHERRLAAWFDDYVETLVQREVLGISNIEDAASMPRLLERVAATAPGPANLAGMGATLGLSWQSVNRYLALLVQVFAVQPVPAWLSSRAKRQAKRQRLLIADTGLMAHLLNVNRAALSAPASPVFGALLENVVGMELVKQAAVDGSRARILQWRTRTGDEVDFVVERRGGQIVGVEVKASASPTAAMFRSLNRLRDAAGDHWAGGVVLHTGDQVVSYDDDLVAWPLSSLWRSG